MKLIATSDFVKRQTPTSQFTHFDGTWEELEQITEQAYRDGDYSDGYRAGVWVVHLPEDVVGRFYTYTDFEKFPGMKLEAVCKKTAGREHEPARVHILNREPKNPCKFVDVIIYSHSTLAEDHPEDELQDSAWEIISVNGRLKEDAPPMGSMTIVRNWMHLPGGTEMKGATAEEVLDKLCNAILYENGMSCNST